MWLDDLTELVGTLKERIEKHGDVLSKNETATRYALIDPLLTALGWDLQDPGQVRTEYNPDGERRRRSDYTMFTGGDKRKSQLVIEAKKLGTRISGEIVKQTIGYCIDEGIPYFVVTNGGDWEIYPTFGEGHIPIKEKRIVDFSLTDPAQTTVMKMLWLWRGNFESESPIMSVVPDRPASQRTATSTPQPPTAKPPASVQRSSRGIPLSEFKPRSRTRPPATLLFPDETEKKIVKWNDLQPSVVRWLIDTGSLAAANCPVESPGGRYLVNTSPVSRNGSKFRSFKKIDNLFIDSWGGVSHHVGMAKKILQAQNIDLSEVRVVMET